MVSITTQHYEIVKRIAKRLHYKYQDQDIDDLVSEGNIGLLKARQQFNSTKNTKFTTYAHIKIRSSIMDYIRKEYKHSIPIYSYEEIMSSITPTFNKTYINNILIKDVFKTIRNKRYKTIVSMRLEDYTLQEIGNRLDVSKEWIRQLLSKMISETCQKMKD